MKPLITPVRPVTADDSAREVLQTLKDRGVAILVDEREEPVGVLTFSDMRRLKEEVPRAKSAADLFERGREIYTVSEADEPVEIARRVTQRGLKTGIVAVDERGRYAGYVFVRDLRELIKKVREDRERVQQNLESLRNEHPAPYERVQRIIKSGSSD